MSHESSQHISELSGALQSLEQAIVSAKQSFIDGGTASNEIMNRFDCYLDVVNKQKILASSMARHAAEQNWEEVRRHGELIRGSSQLIQLEAESFIEFLLNKKEPREYQA